jgi:hypothetical protein
MSSKRVEAQLQGMESESEKKKMEVSKPPFISYDRVPEMPQLVDLQMALQQEQQQGAVTPSPTLKI